MNKKWLYFIFAAILTLSNPLYAADQWDADEPAGTKNASDIDFYIGINNSALDRLVKTYRLAANVLTDSTTTIKVLAGEIAIPDSAGSVVRWRRNSSSQTITAASNLDTGASLSNSTQYFVYGTADDDETGFDVVVSESSSQPSGYTYYRMIGYFYVNSDGDIVNIGNVKGGDVANIMEVSDQEDYSTSSTSYADISGMTMQFRSTGRPIVVEFRTNVKNPGGNGQQTYFTVDVDGTDYGDIVAGEGTHTADGHNAAKPLAFTKLITGLSSGVKTIKIQWKTPNGTANIQADSSVPKFDNIMIVREL